MAGAVVGVWARAMEVVRVRVEMMAKSLFMGGIVPRDDRIFSSGTKSVFDVSNLDRHAFRENIRPWTSYRIE